MITPHFTYSWYDNAIFTFLTISPINVTSSLSRLMVQQVGLFRIVNETRRTCISPLGHRALTIMPSLVATYS